MTLTKNITVYVEDVAWVEFEHYPGQPKGKAKRFRLEAPSEEELIKEYIDLKIRAFIRIRDQAITDFYQQHLIDFQGKELDEVRDQIETYLIENELNQRLKSHIDELRGKSCVKVQLNHY